MIKMYKDFIFAEDSFVLYMIVGTLNLAVMMFITLSFGIKLFIIGFLITKLISIIIACSLIFFTVKNLSKEDNSEANVNINNISKQSFNILLFSITHVISFFICVVVEKLSSFADSSRKFCSNKVKSLANKEEKQNIVKETYRD